MEIEPTLASIASVRHGGEKSSGVRAYALHTLGT